MTAVLVACVTLVCRLSCSCSDLTKVRTNLSLISWTCYPINMPGVRHAVEVLLLATVFSAA
jgi:hypothetical protein